MSTLRVPNKSTWLSGMGRKSGTLSVRLCQQRPVSVGDWYADSWFIFQGLNAGDRVDGWEVAAFPGHADGHLCLLKDGLMIAGDHLLPEITPSIGLYPEARPDPLGDYLESLRRTIELRPRAALPGHGDPIADPAGRAAEILRHHGERLDRTEALLGRQPRTAYDLSLGLFGRELAPAQRRFAVAETLSHVERLVVEGRAARAGDDRALAYTGR